MKSKIKSDELKYKLNLIQVQREFKEGIRALTPFILKVYKDIYRQKEE